MQKLHAAVTAVGGYVPEFRLTNFELEKMVDTNDEWIRTRTGIEERRILKEEGKGSSDLGAPAVLEICRKRGISPEEIECIICATVTPDMVFPSTACILQHKLGAKGCPAFDVQAVCSGFLYALTIAEKFIRSGSHRRALVVGAEVFSRILDWNDRGTCVLFGDGAGAVVLEASEQPGILATALHADGSHHGILSVPGNVCGGQIIGDPFLRMDGQAVFKFAVRVLADVAHECCDAAKVAPTEIDWLIPHQANIRIIEATAKKMHLPMERVVVTVDQHGNTSAASVPLALDAAVRDGRIQRGQKIMLEGVGGGFTWGAALIEF